ncbi:mitochondrial coenzyme A diphosphatase NUDT8 [Musca vetustissima]|uniref:mitochondrial coenzyme A diphosphatase NUDT8 n=1 Tax=Musca vetustissima TaxID=27455 RepID=UPI002AB7EC3E|nr:mitochondrial coenzyme A diphosphatase NUDT8 [Musca vetustissima]
MRLHKSLALLYENISQHSKRFYHKTLTNTCQHTNTEYAFDEDVLLSKENQQRCLEKMKAAAPMGLRLRGNQSEMKFAAVLIAICTDENGRNPSILYTRRARTLRRHMRQISFPGGIQDENEDFITCALRETEEEIGLPRSRVEIWGTGNLIKPPHTAAIMPVIGAVKNFRESELNLNVDEVEEAFAVPISRLAHPQTLHYTQFQSGYSGPVFIVDVDKKIWGITGFLTNTFLNCFLPPEMNYLKNRVKYIRPLKIDAGDKK